MGVRVSVYDMSERQRFLSSVCVSVRVRTCLCICFLLSLNSLVFFVIIVWCVKCLTLLLY